MVLAAGDVTEFLSIDLTTIIATLLNIITVPAADDLSPALDSMPVLFSAGSVPDPYCRLCSKSMTG